MAFKGEVEPNAQPKPEGAVQLPEQREVVRPVVFPNLPEGQGVQKEEPEVVE